jgi:Mg2+ and Co2+ transporter CorA
MRVTKIIREYITEAINAKYQPIIDAINKEYELVQTAYDKNQDAAKDEIRRMGRIIWEKYMSLFYDKAVFEKLLKDYDPGTPWCYRDRPSYIGERNDRIDKITNERDTAIKNIVVKLELGGSKEDLDEMLAAINP